MTRRNAPNITASFRLSNPEQLSTRSHAYQKPSFTPQAPIRNPLLHPFQKRRHQEAHGHQLELLFYQSTPNLFEQRVTFEGVFIESAERGFTFEGVYIESGQFCFM